MASPKITNVGLTRLKAPYYLCGTCITDAGSVLPDHELPLLTYHSLDSTGGNADGLWKIELRGVVGPDKVKQNEA